MAGPNELDVSTVLEALQALNDGIAIYGPDDRQLFVNEVAYRRFRTYYQGMADGLTHLEALTAQFRLSLPDASDAEIHEMAQAHYAKFQSGETYMTKTEDGRTVLATFRQMSRGRKAGISIDVTDLRRREREDAVEARDEGVALYLVEMRQDLAVRAGVKAAAARGQLALQRPEIVDLAVVHDDRARAVGLAVAGGPTGDRLLSGRRVHDGEATMAEHTDPGLHMGAPSVRAAMRQPVGGPDCA